MYIYIYNMHFPKNVTFESMMMFLFLCGICDRFGGTGNLER